MSNVIPDSLSKFFWGDDLNELSWPEHKQYITQTLLDKGNHESLKWLFSKVTNSEVRSLLPKLKLSKKSSNFWHTYLQ